MSGKDLQTGSRPSRVIALDWYDGPILGFVEYAADDKPSHFRFTLVGGVGYESRVFLLGDASPREWEEAVALLGEASPPHWPVWALHIRSGTDDWRDRANEMVRSLEKSASRPVAVIEAESLEGPIGAVRKLGEDERVRVARMLEGDSDHEEWVSFCRDA
jgi:hypothetical protein